MASIESTVSEKKKKYREKKYLKIVLDRINTDHLVDYSSAMGMRVVGFTL